MESFPLELRGSPTEPQVIVVRLESPGRPVVVLDEGLIQRLEHTLNNIPDGMAGLVLASASERSFVAGADLKTVADSSDADLMAYLEYGAKVFGMLCNLGYPTAAAIGGAALGGGLELAMHCDGLVGGPSPTGRPYPVGLPEAGLCICPGWGGTNLLPARLDPAKAIEMTASGKTMLYDEAVGAGLFDATVDDAGELVEAAVEWVRGQGTPERDGAPSRWIGRRAMAPAVSVAMGLIDEQTSASQHSAAVLDAVRAGLENGWEAGCRCEREHLVRLRHTPEAKQAIEAFFARSKKK
jgi:enoyl-CoA hydratase/carnithine racemase